MTIMSRKKQEAVIVARSHGTERELKVTVVSIQGDNVTLDFDLGAGVSIHSSEDWDRAHAARKAANESRGSDRPMQKAPYSD